jgi:hypothetical protein
MLPQLLLAKRLYIEASNYADRTDAVSGGIAISMLQDAAELYLWAVIKERNLVAKDQAGFVANMDTIQKAGISLLNSGKLLELNKARVSFKHYGILPATNDARKYQAYVEDFLRTSTLEHFKVNFDDLSLVDLVADTAIRDQLKLAEAQIESDKVREATEELAKAKTLIFNRLQKFIPKVDSHLSDSDKLLNSIGGVHGARTFNYISAYLGILRESCLVAILQLPLDDYSFVQNYLPSAKQAMTGRWQITHSRGQYTEAECSRALASLVNLCVRLETIA